MLLGISTGRCFRHASSIQSKIARDHPVAEAAAFFGSCSVALEMTKISSIEIISPVKKFNNLTHEDFQKAI